MLPGVPSFPVFQPLCKVCLSVDLVGYILADDLGKAFQGGQPDTLPIVQKPDKRSREGWIGKMTHGNSYLAADSLVAAVGKPFQLHTALDLVEFGQRDSRFDA